MNVTLSIDDRVMREARRRAEAMGTSLNQLVRKFLEQLAGWTDPESDAAELAALTRRERQLPRMEVQPRGTARTRMSDNLEFFFDTNVLV
jgi:antitoxin component of RelBE/YafQ-DinJ toxin-antitoxin module